MKRALVCVLMAAWSLGCGSQTVHQPAENVYAMKGGSVTLDCSYENSGGNDYILWYKQDGQVAPKFIMSLSIRSQGKTESSFEKRFSCSINDTAKRAPLKIQDVQLCDSTVFYCAMQSTMTDSSAAPTQKPLSFQTVCLVSPSQPALLWFSPPAVRAFVFGIRPRLLSHQVNMHGAQECKHEACIGVCADGGLEPWMWQPDGAPASRECVRHERRLSDAGLQL
ncbi:uncharacterized protein LOC133559395 [Nerophis ophidion]|uniref:uncharacterized protein LOC133559395 n=1 Tax=Nerophis ophidion TaxID=159077 RepID=UPI002AE069FE|nr:uncharacterized protein LOC133559395 [Nerophis ophidion]